MLGNYVIAVDSLREAAKKASEVGGR